MKEQELLKRLYTSKHKPNELRDFSAEELGELVLIVLEHIKQVHKQIEDGKVKGEPARQLVPDVDYLSLKTTEKELSKLGEIYNSKYLKDISKLEKKIDKKLSEVRNGKDAKITQEQLQEIARQAFELVNIPDIATYITKEPQAIRNALEILKEDERLHISAISGIEEVIQGLKQDIANVRSIKGGAVGKSKLEFLTDVDVSGLTKTNGKYVLGSGGSGSGDMTKAVYDTNNDGVVNKADTITNQGALATLDTVGTSEIDNGAITNSKIANGAVGYSNLSGSVQSSLDLADSALQTSDIGTTVQAHSLVLDATTASFLVADETKLDGIETGAQVNTVDSVNSQTGAVVLDADDISDTSTVNKWSTGAEKTKLGYISVTQAVDLDQMENDIAALANGMVYKGDWDASVGTFPGGGVAQTGWFYYVSVGGTVDGVTFHVGDNLVATTDNASTTTYTGNWSKHDNTDAVTSVAGKTGNVTIVAGDLADFDTEVSNNTDVTANTSARHTHANKAILDATTASFTTADETKLDALSTTAQWSENGSNIYRSTGNVGIGTSTPSQKLDVVGTGRFTNTNAYPLEINRGLDVKSVGAASAGIRIGSLDGTTYKEGAVIFGQLAADGNNGSLLLQTRKNNVMTTFLTATSSGNVGIGTTSPSEKLDVNGTTRTTNLKIDSLTTNYIPKAGTGGVLSNSQIFDNGTNVGIGSESTGDKFYVNGGIRADYIKSSELNTTFNYLHRNSANYAVYIQNTNTSGNLLYLSNGSATPAAGTLRFVVKGDGSVGVGTETTPKKLTVNGDIQGTELTLTGLTSGYLPRVGSGGLLGNSVIYQDGSNVGIGTANPTSDLHLSGSAKDRTIHISTGLGNANTAKVLFGTASREWELKAMPFASNKYNAIINYNSSVFAGDFGIENNGVRLFTVNPNGNVGIGTTSPSEKLDVNGNAKVTGTLTVEGTTDGIINSKASKTTLAGTEEVLINDAGTLKKTTTQDIADLGGGGGGIQMATFTIAGGSASGTGVLNFVTEYNGITGLSNSSGTITLPVGEYFIDYRAYLYSDSLAWVDYQVNSVTKKSSGRLTSDTSDPTSTSMWIKSYENITSTSTIRFNVINDWTITSYTSSNPTDGAYLTITKIA